MYAEPIVLFTDVLCIIAKSYMPKTTAKQKKRCKPWFNTECKDAMKARKSALASFKTNITSENLSNFRIARARARRACRENKRASWQQYVSRLNSRTTLKSTWDMVVVVVVCLPRPFFYKVSFFKKNAFVGRKHLVSIFFDLEKAYDTTWKHGILLDLYKTGLRGRLPMFICDFFYPIVILKFVLEIHTLILTHRRQVSHRVVFFLSRYLVSRLIVLYLVYYLILNVPFM